MPATQATVKRKQTTKRSAISQTPGRSISPGWGGGGADFGFQVTGMIEWGKNQHPTKSLGLQTKPQEIHGPKFSPQRSHAEFSSHKNFQKELNDITQEIEKKYTDQNFLT